MAIFKNPPPEGFIYPAISEKQFINILKDLPSKWMFWYEPIVHGGQTPDFVIWIPAEEFPAIFLIELKNWRRTFVSRADMTYVYLRNNRVEYNPISKLQMVRNNLNETLTMHYRSAPGLEKIPVIPLLVHWGMETKEALKALPADFEVEVLPCSPVLIFPCAPARPAEDLFLWQRNLPGKTMSLLSLLFRCDMISPSAPCWMISSTTPSTIVSRGIFC
jgi:hypothetical protein